MTNYSIAPDALARKDDPTYVFRVDYDILSGPGMRRCASPTRNLDWSSATRYADFLVTTRPHIADVRIGLDTF